MSLEIHTAVQTAIVLALIGIIFLIWGGIRSIRNARALKFFRMRRDRMMRGWRMLFFAIVLGGLAIIVRLYAEPIAYTYFPPTATITTTPTITLTTTITLTPTVTLTPTITLTPAVTDTPTITPTPHVPLAIESRFEGTVTPAPEAAFSNLIFTQEIDEDTYQPVNPGTVFQNPVGHMYALFSYDKMIDGAQWSALWYRGNELVYFETEPWDGGTGGFGFTDWNPAPEEWLPGDYEVQIFVGYEWKVSGIFTVEGEAPTPVPSPTPTLTPTPQPTPTPSPTITLTPTATSTRTPPPSSTPTFTPHPSPTGQIPTATYTRQPTATATITPTKWPTATPITPTPTITRHPTATNPPTPTKPSPTP